MKQIFTIASLTWSAAFRYRLFWVLTVLLIGAVVGLPLLLQDDGSAAGLTQILLTYTLSAITALLGFATLWLACGTMARDIEENQMQVVAVKPIARWQIWLGKWIGILALNAALLAISGASVFILLKVRAQQLPAAQQAILAKEIFVARASLKEPPTDVDSMVEERLSELIRTKTIDPRMVTQAREQIKAGLLAQVQVVPSGSGRIWTIDFGLLAGRMKNQPLQARFKFHSSDPNTAAIYKTRWEIGARNSTDGQPIGKIYRSPESTSPADSFQEFTIPPNLIGPDGKLTVVFINDNNTTLLFPLTDGLEILYPEGTFGLNFIRGLGVILCWLALLATIGLAAASWLSFPVAAFFSLALLFMGLSSGTLAGAVEQGTILGVDHETGAPVQPAFDGLVLPLFQALLAVINLVQGFSPIDSLSTGRSITWGMLGLAATQIVLLLGGIFTAVGVVLFTRRELAAVQSNS